LPSGSTSANDLVDPDLIGNGLCGIGIVAGEQHGAQAELVQPPRSRRRALGLTVSATAMTATRVTVDRDIHRRAAESLFLPPTFDAANPGPRRSSRWRPTCTQ